MGFSIFSETRGKDFQRSFQSLGGTRALTSAPFIALTASAPPDIEAEICSLLELKDPVHVKLPLDRPNIYLRNTEKTGISVSYIHVQLKHTQY